MLKFKMNVRRIYYLKPGDEIQKGDQAYTWNSPECVELGWIRVPKTQYAREYVDGMVKMRRIRPIRRCKRDGIRDSLSNSQSSRIGLQESKLAKFGACY